MSPETAAEIARIRGLVDFRSEAMDRPARPAEGEATVKVCRDVECDAPLVRRPLESPSEFLRREFCCPSHAARTREREKRRARTAAKANPHG